MGFLLARKVLMKLMVFVVAQDKKGRYDLERKSLMLGNYSEKLLLYKYLVVFLNKA